MAITPETAGAIDAPNTLNSETAGSVSAPNTLTSETAGSVAAPNTLTSESAGAVAVPNTLTSETASSVAVPNTLTSETAGAIAVPNTLSSESAASVAVPNTIGAVSAAGLPRTLTPMLKLDFADDSYQQSGSAKTLLDIVTYSRSSSATFINRQVNQYGQYEYFIDNDYVGDVENLITYSEQFDNSAWTKSSTTVTANATKAPDGTTSADKLTAASASGIAYQTITVTSGQEYTYSAYLKNIDSTVSRFKLSGSGKEVYINWSGNTITSLSNISSGATASYKKIGDFYRVDLTFTTTSTSESCFIYPDYANGTSSIYVWGAQLTESAKVLPYVKTIDTTVTKAFTETVRREYDPETGKNLGALIEGGSTNLLTRSEEFDNSAWIKSVTVTANATKAPDGTTSADKLYAAGSTAHRIYQAATVTSGQEHTYSAYFKNIDSEQTLFYCTTANKKTYINWSGNTITSLSGISSGATASYKKIGDFYRVELTFTTASTSESCRIYPDYANGTGSVYAWGAQLEQKPFATSYIRTEGAAVSRASDALSVDGVSSLPQGGEDITVGVKVSYISAENHDDYSKVFRLDGQSLYLQRGLSGDATTGANFSGTAVSLGADFNNGDTYLLSITQNSSETKAYQDGVIKQASSSGAVSAYSNNNPVYLGSASGSQQFLFGHIAEFSTYNTALTAQEVSIL
jgi:uncharacterized protein involved in tolerance to divalent cations